MEYGWMQLEQQDYINSRVLLVQRVDGFTPCWEWTLKPNPAGYGIAFHKKTPNKAHRLSYMAFKGGVGEMQVDHLCFNRLCVNPDHLEAVTGRENVQRAVARSRSTGGKNWARETMCRSGRHEMVEGNIYHSIVRGNPTRTCKACNEEHRRNKKTSASTR